MSETVEALEALIETLETAEVWVRVIEEVMEEEGLAVESTLGNRVQAAKVEAESLLAQALVFGEQAG